LKRKRAKRDHVGLFDVPDRRNEDDQAGVLGGASGDSGLFGGAHHSSGLFDAPDRTPGDMPGLFDRAVPPAGDDADSPGKPARRPAVGLFDKPPRAAGGGLFDRPAPRRK
jgi:hypothetical protein